MSEMTRDQMIAWLTLEGWTYYYWPPDHFSKLGVDGFYKDRDWFYIDTQRSWLGVDAINRTTKGIQYPRCNLPYPDLAVVVKFIEGHYHD